MYLARFSLPGAPSARNPSPLPVWRGLCDAAALMSGALGARGRTAAAIGAALRNRHTCHGAAPSSPHRHRACSRVGPVSSSTGAPSDRTLFAAARRAT
eukprot:7894670-Alexandrium_andersonii.AAC.1